MSETPKEVKAAVNAVRQCKWRKNVFDTDFCTGMCNPCAAVIERGECDTLKKLFSEQKGVNHD